MLELEVALALVAEVPERPVAPASEALLPLAELLAALESAELVASVEALALLGVRGLAVLAGVNPRALRPRFSIRILVTRR